MKTIYYNGAVYTGTLPLAEAFVVEGEKFTFAGPSAQALSLYEQGDQRVDLEGAFVCAGFNDSHMHLLNYGRTLSSARLDQNTHSLAAMIQCLRDFAENGSREGGWVMGRGWNQDYFTDANRMPTRWDLDKASAEVPICAVRACGHALVVNSRGLEVLGVTADTPQPAGGEIGIENGEPNGLFFDNAMDLVYGVIPPPGKEEVKGMIRAACAALNAYGVTSSQSDDYCVFAALPWQTVNEAYRELEESGELTVRVCQQSNFTNLTALKEFVEAGNRTGTGSRWYRIGPLKMLGDGALGPRTAFLSRPYADDPSTCGIPVFSQETFDEMISYANGQGMQVAIHAIGDACLDRVLTAVGKALEECPREDHRHGIVHCQITRPDQLQKIAQMRLHVYAQSIFLDYDTRIVEPRVGAELAATSYSWKTLLKTGATVSNGTDCPVELPFALGGIQCAVTRTALKGGEAYLPKEAFTVQEALDSYTSAGAYASFEETVKGKIVPGMLADFVVLGDNPFTVAPEQVSAIPVLATYVEGACVWEKAEELTLGPITEREKEAVLRLVNDETIKQTYMIPDFRTADEAENLFCRLKELSLSEDRYVAGIFLEGRLIGFINDTEILGDSIEVGYVIDPAFHNRGYGTRALCKAIQALFQRGFRQVVAGAFEDNLPSIRVMVKSGMTKLERQDEVEYRGRVHRCVYYAIEKPENTL